MIFLLAAPGGALAQPAVSQAAVPQAADGSAPTGEPATSDPPAAKADGASIDPHDVMDASGAENTPQPAPSPTANGSKVDNKAKAAGDAVQSPGEQLFSEKCSSCHSIGKGDRVGPDLKNAHERRDAAWLSKMIATPSAQLSSDPDARALLKKFNNVRMPDLGLTPDQVTLLIETIARCSVQTCNLAGVFVAVTEAGPADVERGRQLFLGEIALVNDGPPCISCHTARDMQASVAGGTLAKDLTHVFARLGDEGLDGALKNPSFPLMKDIYANRKLDKDEVFALRAYFSSSNRSTTDEDSISVFLVATIGTILCFFILNLFWRRRLLGVRKPLVGNRVGRQGVTS